MRLYLYNDQDSKHCSAIVDLSVRDNISASQLYEEFSEKHVAVNEKAENLPYIVVFHLILYALLDTYMSCFADHVAELRCCLFINNFAPSVTK